MPLSTAAILEAAREILAQYGLQDLSMRRIATALDVQPGALYNHVPDKQTLLGGVADLILADVREPLGRWRPAIEEWARDLRRVLLSLRDSAELVATARGFDLSRHDPTRHPATLLAAAGLPPDEARAAAATLLHFVLGYVAEEQARLDSARFGHAEPGQVGGDGGYALGVALILDGVVARLPAEG